MKLLSRVVWSEGMHLAPHHFQTQTRYFEDAIRFAVSALWFKPYGLAACEMDSEALKNGTVSVLQARGLFPDGLPFYITGSDPPPEARGVGHLLSPLRDSQVIHLAIPRREAERGVPSAEEEQRCDARDRQHIDVLGDKKQAEAQARVLGVETGNELRLGFYQIEWHPIRFRDRGDDEDHAAD